MQNASLSHLNVLNDQTDCQKLSQVMVIIEYDIYRDKNRTRNTIELNGKNELM